MVDHKVLPEPNLKVRPRSRCYLWTAALTATMTGIGLVAREWFAAPDLVMLYLLAIGIVAALFGRGPSIIASALSVLAYNFFFVPPIYTFRVDDQRNILTFAMMFFVGLSTSALTSRIRRQAAEAGAREKRTAALYALSRDLGAALGGEKVASTAVGHAAQAFGGSAIIFLPDASGVVSPQATSEPPVALGEQDTLAVRWACEHKRLAGLGTANVPEAHVLCIPMHSEVAGECLGVLALALGKEAAGGPSADQRLFMDAFARQVALAFERSRLADAAKTAALRARTEEMRSSLLSSVSHDLRTPLAAITGAATTLREDDGALPAHERAELLETVCEEAERLDRLVRNLLDMTHLESGALRVKREWVPLEEIVGGAINRMELALAGRVIRTQLHPDLPLISADPVLLEQVLINLLENARKYTPAGSPIDISARICDRSIEIEVSDRGSGLPAGSESRIFEKFFRAKAGGTPGVGLGLAICRGIVEAHGGTITAENRPGGGATFRISLAQIGEAPSVATDGPPSPAQEGKTS
jgi:two-component system, OmpR family, sensor histidine kinase KdpD